MLDLAIRHKDKLLDKFASTFFDPKYMYYYNGDGYCSTPDIATDTYNIHQFVSLDKDGNIIGYLKYKIDHNVRAAYGFAAMNFTDNIVIFSKDLKQVLIDIFLKFNLNKLDFNVTCGNPIEKSYDKIVARYGGRVLGIYKDDTITQDGVIHDSKAYEIMRSEFLEHYNRR